MHVHFPSNLYDWCILNRYMRTECMEHEFIYGRKMPVEMLIRQVADSINNNFKMSE